MSTTTTIQSKANSSTSTRLSASCQQIVFEDFTQTTNARVIVRSCLSDPDIYPSITGHVCNGVALTSSGHYADMASVVAAYIWRRDRGQHADLPGINVCNMHVDKTFIIKTPPEGAGQWLEMEAIVETPESSSGDMIDSTIQFHFRSIKPDGTKLNDLGRCSAKYEWMPGWLLSWSNYTDLLRTQIQNLHTRAHNEISGDVEHMYKQKAYIRFKTFVDYGPKYQNMAEVVVDTKTLEGTANLAFQPDPEIDYTGPYYVDGSCHLSGFICNAIEKEGDAYISHGFDGMKISNKFSPAPGANIKNYVRMQPLPQDPTVLCGDVYVLQDEEIVGLWEGVKFKKIPRRVLNIFLPPPKK